MKTRQSLQDQILQNVKPPLTHSPFSWTNTQLTFSVRQEYTFLLQHLHLSVNKINDNRNFTIKFSCCWQTARRLCKLSRAVIWWMTAIYCWDFPTYTYPLSFDALKKGIPSSYWIYIWYGNTRMAGLKSGKGRMMIDSVVWAQYINVTDTHRQPRRHNKCHANALHHAAKK